MNSRLDEIYAAIAAMSVSLNGASVRVLSYDATPDSVEDADAPVRLLLPVPQDERRQVAQPAALEGNRLRVTWGITDLCLLAKVGNGTLKGNTATLINYQRAYLGAFGVLKGYADPSTRLFPVVEPLVLNAGTFEYPTKVLWWGVSVTWKVREVMV